MISLFIDQDPAPPVGFNLTYICCNNNTNDIIIDQDPAPRVGFNLTYICPEGQVFDRDWFATPFVMLTCQVKKK